MDIDNTPYVTHAQKPRRVVCAANRHGGYLLIGARHWDAQMRAQAQNVPEHIHPFHADWEQGFIDQYEKFMTREEAWLVAEAAGQIRYRCGGDMSSEGVGKLYSENLY